MRRPEDAAQVAGPSALIDPPANNVRVRRSGVMDSCGASVDDADAELADDADSILSSLGPRRADRRMLFAAASSSVHRISGLESSSNEPGRFVAGFVIPAWSRQNRLAETGEPAPRAIGLPMGLFRATHPAASVRNAGSRGIHHGDHGCIEAKLDTGRRTSAESVLDIGFATAALILSGLNCTICGDALI